jgi:transposase
MKPTLCLGIDIGKKSHYAAFRSEDRSDCPTLKIDNTRESFEALTLAIQAYVPDQAQCAVLCERTGHYGAALEQYLQDQGMQIYRIQAVKRYGKNKTDKADAIALARKLENYFADIKPSDPLETIRPLLPESPSVVLLRGLVYHRYELTQEQVRRQNKLTSINDQLFPELPRIYKDPNAPSALSLRTSFPTPQAVAEATLDELCLTRTHTRPSTESFRELQRLARLSIGVRDPARCASLVLEQSQLIEELQLHQAHVTTLETVIAEAMEHSREGLILASMPGVGSVLASSLLAGIGSINRFPSASKLRGYCGWSPVRTQTGTTKDSQALDPGGNKLLKRTMYLVALLAIRRDPTWRALYDRLVIRKCEYDARLGCYRGKRKVIGRICGQLIGIMYFLLRKDADLLANLKPGEETPAPELYDSDKFLPQQSQEAKVIPIASQSA